MGVQANNALFPLRDAVAKQLDLVGEAVGLSHLYCCRQILAVSGLHIFEHTRIAPTNMILSSSRPSAQTLAPPSSHVFLTASQTSTAYSVSVCEKVSGEYSKRKLVPCCSEVSFHPW